MHRLIGTAITVVVVLWFLGTVTRIGGPTPRLVLAVTVVALAVNVWIGRRRKPK